MRKVFKYHLFIQDDFTLELPRFAEILTVITSERDGNAYLYALVDPRESTEKRRFRLAGTSHPIDLEKYETPKYIGTFQMLRGELVFHLFEV